MSLSTPQNDNDVITTEMVQEISFKSEADLLRYFAKETATMSHFLYHYNHVVWDGQFGARKTTMNGFVSNFEKKSVD
jgi:hypothetical protein